MSVELIDLHPAPADLYRLVQAGLAQQPKQLPAWLLYDAEGSRLFAEICQQPEYTLTRTEITLLEQQATKIQSMYRARVGRQATEGKRETDST